LANQVASNLISGGSSCGHDLEVRNLLLLNVYMRTVSTDASSGAGNSAGIALVNCGSNLHVHDLTSTWAHTNILVSANSSVANWELSNNGTAHSTWGIAASMGGNAQIGSNVKIYGNDINNGPDWDDPSDLYHRDGIFVYGHSSTGYFDGIYVYNNYVHGNWGTGATITSFVYTETSLHNLYIFNNVFQLLANSVSNGQSGTAANVNQFLFNNTVIGYNPPTDTGGAFNDVGDGVNARASTTIENNVIYEMGPAIDYRHSGASSLAAINNNDYFGIYSGGVGFACDSDCASTWTAWRAKGWDANGSNADPKLNPNATLQFGSAAIGLGKNLYSICSGQPNPGLGALCYDKAGVARPAIGSWDAGAYNFKGASGATILPPTGLTAIVH